MTSLSLQNFSVAPVLRSIQVLESGISGMDKILPAGTSLSFRYPCQLIVTNNSVGKSAFARMLFSSAYYSNFFEQNQISAFSEAFKLPDGLYSGLTKSNKEVAAKLVGAFCYQHASDYIFLKHLSLIDRKDYQHVLNHEHNKIKFTTIKKLFENLKSDTDLNRFFWIKLHSNSPILPIFQDTIDYREFSAGKNIKNSKIFVYDTPGIFDPTFDGKNLNAPKIDLSLLRKKFDIPEDSVEFNLKQVFDMLQIEEQALSPGKTSYAIWTITKQKIINALEGNFAYVKDPLPKGSWHLTEKPKKITLNSGTKILVFLDEPTTFLDSETQNRLANEIAELLVRFKDRLQFVITTNDMTFMSYMSAYAETIDLSCSPAIVKDTASKLEHLRFSLRPQMSEDYSI